MVKTLVRACESPRPGRDVAVTGAGRLQLLAARHAPRLVDRVVARQIRKRVDSGAFDGAEIAAGLRERHGRGAELDSPRAPHQDRRHDRSGLR